MRPMLREAAFALALTTATGAFAQGSSDPTGTWLTEDGRARIRIERCGPDKARLCGYVAWLRDPLDDKGQPRTDIHNPDPSKRSRPAIGMQILLGLKPDGEGRYTGEIYNSENGKKYAAAVAIKGPGELDVEGCVMGGLFCGGQTWTRTAALPSGSERGASQSGSGSQVAGRAQPGAGAIQR